MVLAFGLPEVIAALAMVLVWLATRPGPATFLLWTLQQIPVVGGAAAGFVDASLASLVGWAQGWVEQGVGAFTALINVPVAAMQMVIGSLVSGIESTIAFALGLGQSLAGAINQLLALTGQLEAAITEAAAQIRLAFARIGALSDALAITESAIIPAAIAHAVAQVEAVARSEVAQAEHAAALGVSGAIASAETFVGAETQRALRAEQAIQAQALGAVDALGRTITGDVTGLGTTLGQDVKTLEGLIGDVSTLVAPLAAAGLIAKLETLAKDVTTMQRDCVDPTCSYLGPQLPSLTAIGDAATLGLLIAAIVAAHEDPQGTATLMAGAAGTIRAAVDAVAGPVLGMSY
ncbi:MAG TPA: hypothetical protein VMU66_05655 [Gaiellales bacterium]|nr:hypothetical protein [Gaiellales bacterium]